MNIRDRTWEVVEAAKAGDTASRLFDLSILILIFLNVLAVIVGSVKSIQPRWGPFLDGFEIVSVAVLLWNTFPGCGLALLTPVFPAAFAAAFGSPFGQCR